MSQCRWASIRGLTVAARSFTWEQGLSVATEPSKGDKAFQLDKLSLPGPMPGDPTFITKSGFELICLPAR